SLLPVGEGRPKSSLIDQPLSQYPADNKSDGDSLGALVVGRVAHSAASESALAHVGDLRVGGSSGEASKAVVDFVDAIQGGLRGIQSGVCSAEFFQNLNKPVAGQGVAESATTVALLDGQQRYIGICTKGIVALEDILK